MLIRNEHFFCDPLNWLSVLLFMFTWFEGHEMLYLVHYFTGKLFRGLNVLITAFLRGQKTVLFNLSFILCSAKNDESFLR